MMEMFYVYQKVGGKKVRHLVEGEERVIEGCKIRAYGGEERFWAIDADTGLAFGGVGDSIEDAFKQAEENIQKLIDFKKTGRYSEFVEGFRRAPIG